MINVDKEALITICHLAVGDLIAQVGVIERIFKKKPIKKTIKTLKAISEYWLKAINDVEKVCNHILDADDLQKYIDDMKTKLNKIKDFQI